MVVVHAQIENIQITAPGLILMTVLKWEAWTIIKKKTTTPEFNNSCHVVLGVLHFAAGSGDELRRRPLIIASGLSV